MINIGIVRFNSSYGGIEHQIINIVKNMDNNLFHFILITREKNKFTACFEEYGDVEYIKYRNIIKASNELKKIIKLRNIKIIQSHMLRESYISSITKLITKDVYHIFRVHTYINCSFIKKWKKKLYHVLAFLLNRGVDIYLPINKMNYDELLKSTKINKNKMDIVHNGVREINTYKCDNREFNYNDIVMIANIEYGKGHDIALLALKELINEDKRYNITFIGAMDKKDTDGNLMVDKIKDLASKLQVSNNIKFLGFVDDIGKELKNKDIIILPSYSEGTPNCLLEAMSIKKMVIASRVGGIPEFIENGKNGFLHNSKDYNMLANEILDLRNYTNEELNVICENGYKTWRNEYSIKNLCNYLELLYTEKGMKNEL